jgi:hypothetical protein
MHADASYFGPTKLVPGKHLVRQLVGKLRAINTCNQSDGNLLALAGAREVGASEVADSCASGLYSSGN